MKDAVQVTIITAVSSIITALITRRAVVRILPPIVEKHTSKVLAETVQAVAKIVGNEAQSNG